MRSTWIRHRLVAPGAAASLSPIAVRCGAACCRLLAAAVVLMVAVGAQAAEWQRWSFAAASIHAGAAVFVHATQRLAVRNGEQVAGSPWTLVSIDGERIWLRALEPHSQRELLRALRTGEALPALPDTRDLGLEAVEVPVIDVAAGEAKPP
jgi:hypothetical protein